jgi:hypothetical protein
MSVCESCLLDNTPDRDFCADCGNYLRWEPTAEAPVIAPPATVKQRLDNGHVAPAHQADAAVAVALGAPGEPIGGAQEVSAVVEAEGEARLIAP